MRGRASVDEWHEGSLEAVSLEDGEPDLGIVRRISIRKG